MRGLQLHSTEQQGRLELLVSAIKIKRQVGECADTGYINCRFSLLRQWICSYLATCKCACVNQKQPMGFILYCCFVTFISTKAMTLNLLQCLSVICGCRAVQINSMETSLALLHMYCHNIHVISSGSPPVFLECISIYLLSIYLNSSR